MNIGELSHEFIIRFTCLILLLVLVQFCVTCHCYGNCSVRVIQETLTSLLCPQVDMCECASHDDTASPGAGQGATLRSRGRLQHRERLQCYKNR